MSNLQKVYGDVSTTPCILIVEDDPILGELLLEALQGEAIGQGILAPSGEKALSILQTITPALFLLDYHLPGMNGLELADQLRRREGGEQMSILLMSASLPQEDGVPNDLRTIQKPFDLEKLLQLITELLAS